MNDLHAILFAYRANPALRELTQHRNTCSIPYGGRYRLIDFMLSNMVNAGVSDVGVIAHASYQSLLDHLGSGKDWDLSRKHGGLRILPPFAYADKAGKGDYIGRMDALNSVRSYLDTIRQKYVVLAGGDLAANLPISEICAQHVKSGVDITAVCSNQIKNEPREGGYFTVGENGLIQEVSIRPVNPTGLEALEVYVLSKSLLLSLVDHCAAHNIFSFREGVLQGFGKNLRIAPYVFEGYYARFQSIAAYFVRSMELLDPAVRADLFLKSSPIRTKDRSNPSTYYGPGAISANNLIADGCLIEGEVENSILFRGVRVARGARVSNCILMQGARVGEGATLRYAIADKNVTVHPGRMLMGHETYPIAIAKNSVV